MSAPGHTIPRLQIGEAFSYGWRKLMEQPGPWLLVALVGALAGGFPNWASSSGGWGSGDVLLNLIGFLVTSVAGFVLVSMGLDVTKGRPAALPSLAGRLGLLVTYAVASFLYSVGVVVGMVFLIVPGILFAIAHFFYGYVVVERETDPLTALRGSRELTRGRWSALFGAGCVAVLVMLLGVLALGIGVLFAIPVNSIAAAHLYRQLQGEPVAP